ncbi:hypothetical protein IJE86_07840 [bacterium]|nr:hypothetical protein [bacterium]
MAMLQGSSYGLPIVVRDASGAVIDEAKVKSGVFQVGELEKRYGDGGEVWYDAGRGCWVVPLSEAETFMLDGVIEWQARFLMENGEVAGTVPKSEFVYRSINKTELAGGGEDVGE